MRAAVPLLALSCLLECHSHARLCIWSLKTFKSLHVPRIEATLWRPAEEVSPMTLCSCGKCPPYHLQEVMSLFPAGSTVVPIRWAAFLHVAFKGWMDFPGLPEPTDQICIAPRGPRGRFHLFLDSYIFLSLGMIWTSPWQGVGVLAASRGDK